MAERIRAHDWSRTPLGPAEDWPASLRVMLGTVLASHFPTVIAWGDDLVMLYNDAYRPLLGGKPEALGRPFLEVWSEIGDAIRPMFAQVAEGEALQHDDMHFIVERGGQPEDAWFTFGLSPIRDEAGTIVGALNTAMETTEAVQARIQLRTSEARYRTLATTAVSTSAQPSLFIAHSTGRPVDDVWIERLHPEDRPGVGAIWAKSVAEQQPCQFDYRLLSADGSWRWARGFAVPVRDEAGAIVEWVGTVTDIHEQRLAEAALREGESRFQRALEAAGMGEATFDIAGGGVRHSPTFATLFGYPPDTRMDLAAMRARYHEVNLDRVRADRDAMQANRKSDYDVEHRVRHPDGTIRWLSARGEVTRDAEGAPAAITAVYWDITERRAAQEALTRLNASLEADVAARTADMETALRALERSEAQLRSISASSYIFQGLLDRHGRVLDANPISLEAIGATLVEVADRPFWETPWFAGTPGLPEHIRAAVPQVIAGGSLREELRLNLPVGGWRWFDLSLRPMRDEAGAVVAVILEAVETTERHLAEEALRQSQKLEAMGQLTGGVAHDFNNLLTPIIGGLDLVQRRGVGGEREQRLVAGALQSAERAKTLVQRLLAFARRQPLSPAAVDLGQLIAGMADLVASTSGPQVRVAVDVADALPPAHGDANQLEMAILNLAVNARDAMPDGGTLTISAHPRPVAAGHASGLAPGDYVCLAVADTGLGMDDATVKRAIEPFFSTKGIGKGTGLGLSMVHGLALQLAGALVINSRPGLGTAIELWLPVSDAPPEAAAHAPAAVPAAGVGTALLVDDEALVRASTADMLAELGYEVIERENAEEALAVFAERPIDILVTDHLMPGMTGVELARAVRQRRPRLPILIVSGYADAEAIAPDLPRLTKPFRQADLAAAVAALR